MRVSWLLCLPWLLEYSHAERPSKSEIVGQLRATHEANNFAEKASATERLSGSSAEHLAVGKLQSQTHAHAHAHSRHLVDERLQSGVHASAKHAHLLDETLQSGLPLRHSLRDETLFGTHLMSEVDFEAATECVKMKMAEFDKGMQQLIKAHANLLSLSVSGYASLFAAEPFGDEEYAIGIKKMLANDKQRLLSLIEAGRSSSEVIYKQAVHQCWREDAVSPHFAET